MIYELTRAYDETEAAYQLAVIYDYESLHAWAGCGNVEAEIAGRTA